jgi:aldose 1-epimerase
MPSELFRLDAVIDGRPIRAAVSTRGASIQRLVVDGTPIVRGSTTAEPALASGVVLAPWPNRVRGARWPLGGEEQRLVATEQPAGNAIHGLLADADYAVIRAEPDLVVLAAAIRRPPGYPFDLEIEVSYRLTADGIHSTIGMRNTGEGTAPVALGVHPYLRVGDASADELSVAIDATATLLLGPDDLPVSTLDVAGTRYDLRRPVGVRHAPGHASFTGLAVTDGRIRLQLLAGASRVEVWADERFRWAQLYLTEDFPGLAPGELAVALEPMTAPPDALNSGTDLRWLAPGRQWSREWGISLVC